MRDLKDPARMVNYAYSAAMETIAVQNKVPLRLKMTWLIAKLVLAPLVKRNYRLRIEGLLLDEWYWADRLLLSWGMYVDFSGQLNKC
jgi:hypothetical protein